VGKVVGKRRKRPADDAIGHINSRSWILHNPLPLHPSHSPSFTHATGLTEGNSSIPDNTPAWTPSVYGVVDPSFLNLDDCNASLNAMDMNDKRTYSMTSDSMSFFTNSGLPTPGISPPQCPRYLSPAHLETRPSSRQSVYPVDQLKLFPKRYTSTPSVDASADDEETVCIKLLAHLKKHSNHNSQPREVQLHLLKKANAVVRRLLRSPNIKSDYACHLLLTSIVNQLVKLCEILCHDKSEVKQEQSYFGGVAPFLISGVSQLDQDGIGSFVREVQSFSITIGDLLKKQPVHGFQHLGRHETFHVELEQRLKKASFMLGS
jgi:hypothetical protein